MGTMGRLTNRKQALSILGQFLALGMPHSSNREDPSCRGTVRLVKQPNLAGSKPPLRVDHNSKDLLRVVHNSKPLISKDLQKVDHNNKPPNSKDLLRVDPNSKGPLRLELSHKGSLRPGLSSRAPPGLHHSSRLLVNLGLSLMLDLWLELNPCVQCVTLLDST